MISEHDNNKCALVTFHERSLPRVRISGVRTTQLRAAFARVFYSRQSGSDPAYAEIEIFAVIDANNETKSYDRKLNVSIDAIAAISFDDGINPSMFHGYSPL